MNENRKVCVFAGTFDPVTTGHENIIKKCMEKYSGVIIVVGDNPKKNPFFTLDERKALLGVVFGGEPRVRITTYAEHSANYADFLRENGVTDYVRGIRSEKDREYEDAYARKNAELYPFVKTVYFTPDPEFSDVSSSLAREKIKNGEDFSQILSEKAYAAVCALLEKRKG